MGSNMLTSEDLFPFVEGATCCLRRMYLHLWRADAVMQGVIMAKDIPPLNYSTHDI